MTDLSRATRAAVLTADARIHAETGVTHPSPESTEEQRDLLAVAAKLLNAAEWLLNFAAGIPDADDLDQAVSIARDCLNPRNRFLARPGATAIHAQLFAGLVKAPRQVPA
jgi:hypothetical protein